MAEDSILTIAIALLRWNHLNPMSPREAWFWLVVFICVFCWAFAPLAMQWWRNRK